MLVLRMQRLSKNQHGDTLIEVLLSITVLAAVLSITYGLASRAFRTLQVARDQMQASLIAQEQLEAVIAIHREVNGIATGLSEFRGAMLQSCSGTTIPTNSGTPFLMRTDAGAWCVDSAGPHPDFPDRFEVENKLDYIMTSGTTTGVSMTSSVKWQEIGSGLNRDQAVTTRLRLSN
jgi:prepilin-type N-terminal cleavage/methylation domain-containing protein